MDKTPPRTATVYYNGACPVCEAGVDRQRGRMAACAGVEWVDVHADPQALEPLGLALEDVRERLHVRDGEGRLHVGADALAALWSLSPRQRWLAALVRRGGGLARWAYDRFARGLYRWNLRRGRWEPADTRPDAKHAPAPAPDEHHGQGNSDPAELARFDALAARWWDEDSEFRPLHRINPHRLRWIDRLSGLAGKQVLDVGCGGGILAEAMAREGGHVTGIDLAGKPLRVARRHADAVGVPVTYAESGAEDWAAERKGRYDVVTCMEMLEHLPRPADVVQACAAMARPGGWVFFSTINRNPLSWLTAIVGAERVLRMLPRGTHTYSRFIKPAELQAMAAGAGLVLRERRGLGYNPFTRRFRLTGFLGVGYLLAFQVPRAGDPPPPAAPNNSAAGPAPA